MPNFLEQLVAEWYEYQGFFVRRNVNVGKRSQGGHEGELDVVAFHPDKTRLVHVETSMDADSWGERETKFARKFNAGKKFVPSLFAGLEPLPEIEYVASIGIGSDKNHASVGGGRVQTVRDLLGEIRDKMPHDFSSQAVPEQFVILRALQFAAECWLPKKKH